MSSSEILVEVGRSWRKSCNVLQVSFPYDSEIVSRVKSLAVRSYIPDYKIWEVPISDKDKLMDVLEGYTVRFRDEAWKEQIITDETRMQAREQANRELQDFVNNFKFKTKPYAHQVEAFTYGLAHERFLLADSMGLGKTLESINISVARKQRDGYRHCLVVCGVNTLKWNWISEIGTHTDERGYILGQRTTRSGAIKIGSTSDKLEDAKNIPENDA